MASTMTGFTTCTEITWWDTATNKPRTEKVARRIRGNGPTATPKIKTVSGAKVRWMDVLAYCD